MSTTEMKIDAILEVINKDIKEREQVADSAMLTLEHMNATAEDYKNANRQLMANSYVVAYLKHIKGVAECRDIKSTENIIRFHTYYQHTKGNLDDGQDVSVGQATVAVILDGYVKKFFDTEA